MYNKKYCLINIVNLVLITLISISVAMNINPIFATLIEKEIEILTPGDITINSDDGNVYILSSENMEILIIDRNINNITGKIPVNFSPPLTIGDYNTTGGEPTSIAYNSNTNQFYVAVNSIYVNNTNPNQQVTCGQIRENLRLVCNILVIDGQTHEITDVINNNGYDLQEIVIDDINNKIFVVNGNFLAASVHELGNVSVIDGQTNEVIDTILVGDSPRGITFDTTNNKIYVANQLSNNISVINLKTNEVTTLPIDGRPIEILFNSFNNQTYFTNGFQGAVSVIDGQTNEVIDTISVGDIPNGISFNPQSGNVYVTKGFKNEVSVIDGQTNEVIDTILVGNNPTSIAFNHINNKLYISNLMNNTLSIINIQNEDNKKYEN